ncbi:hypothetical protein TIFTF001_016958 [Ficus carica]|uniref:Uncharacterized protein n=1 Tax=Ficus carica TaxID=3494 RepID=A0AA88A428_FICCA|nr:hypothetical protein TIFTF001_016958 [Ficus carica]
MAMALFTNSYRCLSRTRSSIWSRNWGPGAVPFWISGSSHAPTWWPMECIGGTILQEFWAMMWLQLCWWPSRYPFKGSFLLCIIPNKYEVSFFRVFALRNAVEKASENWLNKSIILGISLQYHCRAKLVRVKQRLCKGGFVCVLNKHVCLVVLQVLISVHRAIIRGYDWHFNSSRVRCNHDCGDERWIDHSDLLQPELLAHQQVELLLEVVQYVLVVRLDLWWRRSVCLLAADVGRVFSGQLGVWRLIPHSLLENQPSHPVVVTPRALTVQIVLFELIGSVQLVRSLQLLPPMWDGCSRVVPVLVACKREAPWSKGDIIGVSAKGTLMLKSVRGIDGSLVVAQAASTMSVWSGGGGWHRSRDKDSCQSVWNGATEAVWADHPARDLAVVGKVLLGLVYWNPMVICSRFPKEM